MKNIIFTTKLKANSLYDLIKYNQTNEQLISKEGHLYLWSRKLNLSKTTTISISDCVQLQLCVIASHSVIVVANNHSFFLSGAPNSDKNVRQK